MKNIKITIEIEEFDGRRSSPKMESQLQHWNQLIRRNNPNEPPEPFDVILEKCFATEVRYFEGLEQYGHRKMIIDLVASDMKDE